MKEYKFKINGHYFTSSVEAKSESLLNLTVNGRAYQVELPVVPAPRPIVHHVTCPSCSPAGGQPVSCAIAAPLPGTITKVMVKAGQEVKRGDVLVVMEAMKMANDIVAEQDGIVEKVTVEKSQSVNQGDTLVIFKAAPGMAAPESVPAAPAKPLGPNTVVSPLPGTVTRILTEVGQKVNAGDTLVTLEAMKMENSITAESAGTVKNILVKQGEQVQSGQALIELV